MRRKFDTDAVPHLWAHKTHEEAENRRGNLYFDGETIYSYGRHFPIAKHGKHKGKPYVFCTTASASNTTAQHIHAVRMAIPPSIKRFDVPNPLGTVKEAWTWWKGLVAQTLAAFHAAKGKPSKAKLYREYMQQRDDAKAFTAFFGIKASFPLPKEHTANLKIVRDQGIATSLRKEAKRERQRSENEAAFAARAIANREREEANRITDAELIEAWRNGRELPSQIGARRYRWPMMLRIVDGHVETSRGVEFPVAHAKRAMRIVEKLLTKGKSWHANGKTIYLGHYQLERIDEEGTVHAGCHHVPKDEVLKLIETLKTL